MDSYLDFIGLYNIIYGLILLVTVCTMFFVDFSWLFDMNHSMHHKKVISYKDMIMI